MSGFYFQPLNISLNQEYIELDWFHHDLVQFSGEEFDTFGINSEDRYFIRYMAEQEVGHATALASMLGREHFSPSLLHVSPQSNIINIYHRNSRKALRIPLPIHNTP
ncbi:hypothetical protein BDQ17DRAFT_771298 [Cyathus striatus]|nr:hypothetical protein BDQ17DRAFT_771298 [Cyathus striatus]